jgi:Bacterial type II and III secretion system protein
MRSITFLFAMLSLLASIVRAGQAPARLVKAEVHYIEVRTEKIPARLRAGPAASELAAYLWEQTEAYSRDIRILASASVIAEDDQEASSDSRKWKAFASAASPTTQPATGPATRPIITLGAEPYSEGVLFRIHPRITDNNAISVQLEFSFSRVDGSETVTIPSVPSVVVQSAMPRNSDTSVQTHVALLPQVPVLLGGQTLEGTSTFVLVRASVLRVQ